MTFPIASQPDDDPWATSAADDEWSRSASEERWASDLAKRLSQVLVSYEIPGGAWNDSVFGNRDEFQRLGRAALPIAFEQVRVDISQASPVEGGVDVNAVLRRNDADDVSQDDMERLRRFVRARIRLAVREARARGSIGTES